MLKDYVVILDESHEVQSSDYRSRVVQPLEQMLDANNEFVKGVIEITATPGRLDFSKYDHTLEYVCNHVNNVSVKLYSELCYDTVASIVNSSNKFSVLMNDIKKLKWLRDKRIKGKKVDVIDAKTKANSELYGNIMKSSTFGDYDGMLHATCLVAGVNIYGKEEVNVVVIGIKDPHLIKQVSARYRDSVRVNLHVFNNYPKEEPCFTYLVNDIEKKKGIAQRMVDMLNIEYQEELGLENYQCAFNFGKDNNFYYCAVQHRYVVDRAKIVSNTYDTYYKTRNLPQLKVLLGQYFKEIDIIAKYNEKLCVDNSMTYSEIKERLEDRDVNSKHGLYYTLYGR